MKALKAVAVAGAHQPLPRPMHPSQYLPCAHQLLNGGGWWEPLSIQAAVVVRRLVDAFDARNT